MDYPTQSINKYKHFGLLLGLGLILLGSFLPWQCLGSWAWNYWTCEQGIGISLFSPSEITLEKNIGLILSMLSCLVVWLNLTSLDEKSNRQSMSMLVALLVTATTLSNLWAAISEVNAFNENVSPFLDDGPAAKLGVGLPLLFAGSLIVLFTSLQKLAKARL
jgi:hypothetical protein